MSTGSAHPPPAREGTRAPEPVFVPTGVPLATRYRVFSDRVYRVVEGRPLHLDLYVPARADDGPSPVLVFSHRRS